MLFIIFYSKKILVYKLFVKGASYRLSHVQSNIHMYTGIFYSEYVMLKVETIYYFCVYDLSPFTAVIFCTKTLLVLATCLENAARILAAFGILSSTIGY